MKSSLTRLCHDIIAPQHFLHRLDSNGKMTKCKKKKKKQCHV